ncbi:MAG: domain S-box [Firmicutes bacterium]|nr:domain S-box [Bacillota bacterium]
MKYNVSDLVDVQNLNNLMKSLYKATGISCCIVDVAGNILVGFKWKQICQDFHRKNTGMEERCRKFDKSIIDNHLFSANPYVCDKCPNGLFVAAAPIIIDGIHIATVIHGQFLFDKPDVNYFIQQAESFGVDKESYMEALAQVPIHTYEKLDYIMKSFIEFIKIFFEMRVVSLSKIDQQSQELQRSDEQIFKIFGSTPNIAIQAYDAFGKIIYWNNASEQFYGFTAAEAIGKAYNSVMYEDKEACELLTILKEINSTNSIYGPAEWRLRHTNGSEKYVYATLFPIKLSNGKKIFICMDVDITEKKQYEKEMSRLDRLNIIGEIAAGIGHEVRNPMTTVRGYLQIFQQKKEFAEYHEQFGIMISELDRANIIISEFLSLAKNKAVEMRLGNLNHVINSIFPLLQADALLRGHEVIVDAGEILDIYFDAKEIRQLILNLVRNGLDAMEQDGVITIQTYLNNGEVILAVQDTGTGIAKEVLEKLGNPFVTTKDSGVGLGLPICYRIAERHGATIDIDTGSSGTTFIIRFPTYFKTAALQNNGVSR